MHFLTSFVLVATLPTLLLASPTPRNQVCVPTTYTVTDLHATVGPEGASPVVHFKFEASFDNSSIIVDPVVTNGGANCDASAPSLDTFPYESKCDTGRASLIWALRDELKTGKLQFIHQWHCNGQQWMSSTSYDVKREDCETTGDGSISCKEQKFAPQNVRQICAGPTHC